MHRDEEYHRPESRAFLKDPQWKRDDIHASLDRFRELKKGPEVKLYQMHEQVIDAQRKASSIQEKMQILEFF